MNLFVGLDKCSAFYVASADHAMHTAVGQCRKYVPLSRVHSRIEVACRVLGSYSEVDIYSLKTRLIFESDNLENLFWPFSRLLNKQQALITIRSFT